VYQEKEEKRKFVTQGRGLKERDNKGEERRTKEQKNNGDNGRATGEMVLQLEKTGQVKIESKTKRRSEEKESPKGKKTYRQQ